MGRPVDTVLYDPLSHTHRDDIYDIYKALRTDHPVYYATSCDVWCLTRYNDVQAAAKDWGTFRSAPGVELDVPASLGPGSFLDYDPPRHDILRQVVRPYFLPKAIAQLNADIERRIADILDELREKETVDLSGDFAMRLPAWVIARLLGIPEEDDDLLLRLFAATEVRVPGEMAVPPSALLALAQLQEYMRELAASKRRHPDDKVLSHLVAGVARGAPTEEEVVGMALILFLAGTETTYSLLGNALNLLVEHPDTLQALRADEPSALIDATIEEALRFETPVQYLTRTLNTTTTVHGVEMRKGKRVVLIWGAANRDPDRWDSPDTFDINRQLRRHLGFGEGIHFCIGAPLARLEARIAIPRFLAAFQHFEIVAKQRVTHPAIRGWERLEATVVPAA